MSLKTFLMKKMLKSKMKGVPEGEIDKMIAMIEKNPDFFQNIAKEVDIEVKKGKSQEAATMEVMRKHQGELQNLMK